MLPNALNSKTTDNDVAVNDLGPLAWVLDELRKSLDSAAKALKRFVRDADAARGSDLAAIDGSQLRIARQQLHQAVGALEMVGLAGPALVLRAMESAVQKFVQLPDQCTQEAAAKIERASFALTEYLEAVLADKPISPVSLFPQYREVQELVRADRIHPADLWPFEWRWIEPELGMAPEPKNYDDVARAAFDQSALSVMKGKSPHAADNLLELSLGFSARQTERQPRIFWKIAAAFFEALSHELIQPDIYVRRAASRVLMQYASLSKGDTGISDRLAQDLLFFCAQAVPVPNTVLRALGAVRKAYALDRFKSTDYETIQYGRFDPALLAQARKRIVSAKETWSSLSAGDANKFKIIVDQFSLVADSLVKLHPPSEPLARALMHAIETTSRSAQAPSVELSMEVATSVLYLEAAFDDLDPNDPQLAARTQHLAQRLEEVTQGGQPQPLELWMEELYRRVSDKQTMGSVVGELRISLGELEKSLDLFFRNPQDKTVLSRVPGQLAQMRGVLSVLGLEQASQAVLRMRDSVEEMLVTQVDEQLARSAGTFDQLGNNLGALSFLIDMLNYQPVLAKKLFVYDAEKGELKPLMGRISKTEERDEAPVADSLPADVMAVTQSAQESTPDQKLADQLSTLSSNAALADQSELSKTAHAASVAVAPQDELAASTALATSISAAAVAQPLQPAADQDFEEDDLQDIFLEEAREVAANGQLALRDLASNPSDVGQLTVLRRVFHTLKGSSRMVGLNAFGDAAWSMEQLFNTWLADQKPASESLLVLSTNALAEFSVWIDDIASGQDARWKAAPFQTSADSLRSEGRYVPLSLSTDLDNEAAAAQAPATLSDTPTMTSGLIAPLMADERTSMPVTAAEPLFETQTLAAFEPVPIALDFTPEATSTLSADELLLEMPFTQIESEAVDVSFTDIDFDMFAEPLPIPVQDAPALSPDALEQLEIQALQQQLESYELEAAALQAAMDADASQALSVPTELSPSDFEAQFLMPAAADIKDVIADDAGHAGVDALPVDVLPVDVLPVDVLPVDVLPVDELPVNVLPVDELPVNALPVDELAVDVSESPPLLTTDLAGNDVDFEVADIAQFLDVPVASDAELSVDEQVKQIGSLRIGIPLYNVYLNEADEWSRILVTEVSEWAIEYQRPIGDSTVALAHSLAGSSATVGFNSLSEIARALEGALEKSQVHHSQAGAAAYAGLFVDAAEDIRRLLHQFAAGFLKEANPQVLASLRSLEFHEPASALADIEDNDFDVHGFLDSVKPLPAEVKSHDLPIEPEQATALAAPTQPVADVTTSVPAVPAALESAAAVVVPLVATAPVFAAIHSTIAKPTEIVVPATPAASASVPVFADEDDDIDAVDAIDLELFPIFEEEAVELMPQLGGALRQWSARPADQSARMDVLRALHTIKGSARLAGAMRLGEMAHRIESEIEYLGSDSAASQDFEPLLARYDAMEYTFDKLRQADAAAINTAEGVSQPVPVHTVAVVAPIAHAETSSVVDKPLNVDPQVGLNAQRDAALEFAPPTTPVPVVGRAMIPAPQAMVMQPLRQAANATIRVRSQLLDRMVNQAGEVIITRSRLEVEMNQLRSSLGDMNDNLNRLRQQLRDIELQAETQMQSRLAQAKELQAGFDPLEFDRFTRVQELTRMMAESVNDVATVQRTLQRTVEATEDDLVAQARQTRELQRDLLRTRMVEFEGISERLYRVVRQASKETGKQVKLDLLGATIEMDRGMLDRMTPAFEHLLRNCVAHGIESPEARMAAGKEPAGLIIVHLRQEGNDVSVEFSDDGAGLNLARIREKALSLGLVTPDQQLSEQDAANMIFMPGFSTASQVTELSGRGIGMDVVRSEVNGVGGRIETTTLAGKGTNFKLILPLTTAVTQVVMLRAGDLSVGVPANVVEAVRRTTAKDLQQAYNTGFLEVGGEQVPFFWSGALLQASHRSIEVQTKTSPVIVFRSAAQRIALHVDEVLGNQEVVVKNLGPQLARLPGLAGMSVLASGAVVLIYNPVALASIYGEQAKALSADSAEPHMLEAAGEATEVKTPQLVKAAVAQVPLIMVVDDSITVRRVTQRLLLREGYRVVMAADGLQALERLLEERPAVVLSDIEMPRMDGFDLARNIRADARLKDLPIVMITSRIAEKHREHAKELGVDHYLGKPYAEDELMSLVRHYCNVEVAA